MKKLVPLLSIAGFDPTAGAGILRDCLVFRHFGFYPTAVITANTVQNTKGVKALSFTDGDFLISQLEAVLKELPPQGVKLGLPHKERSVNEEIARRLKCLSVPVVFDPVLSPTLGKSFVKNLKSLEPLLEVSTVITPNYSEFVRLKGEFPELLTDKTLVIKGEPVAFGRVADRLVVKGREVAREEHEKDSLQVRGTGCSYSSALVSLLARGMEPPEAFKETSALLSKWRKGAFKPTAFRQGIILL
jgi:hydroxymethylpyrimidine/phosphomethylpyrimidine kinase